MIEASPQYYGNLPADQDSDENDWEELPSKWLRRLALVSLLGLVVFPVYAFQSPNWSGGRAFAILGLGLTAAGAAWLSGALTGFIFGIPHARETATPRRVQQKKDAGEDLAGEEEQDDRYKPSTSLEQIADWLTKIIVGVGLTQLNNIPGKLDALAAYIAGGMGNAPANKPFVLAVIIYFSVAGFLFGFLWSRLYMLRAFAGAELLKAIARLSQFDLDNKAMSLVNQQLALDAPEVDPKKLTKAIARASAKARGAIFERAKEVRKAASGSTADASKSRALEIFRSLISRDEKEGLDFDSHAQVGYIFQDLGRPDESIKELTRAMQIRNDRGKRGSWLYYELRRALVRIKMDQGRESKKADREAILADLDKARQDANLKVEWEKNKEDIRDWLKRNQQKESLADHGARASVSASAP